MDRGGWGLLFRFNEFTLSNPGHCEASDLCDPFSLYTHLALQKPRAMKRALDRCGSRVMDKDIDIDRYIYI